MNSSPCKGDIHRPDEVLLGARAISIRATRRKKLLLCAGSTEPKTPAADLLLRSAPPSQTWPDNLLTHDAMDELQKRIPPLTGPLLPLLPPKPLNRRLPRLPPRPATAPPRTALAPGWTCESLVLPAAFPRMFPMSTKRPDEPTRDPTAAAKGTKSDLNAGFDRLVREQLEAFTHPVSLDDRDELDQQEQLVIVGNRYRPPPPSPRRNTAPSGPGLTLVLSHANGFYKGECTFTPPFSLTGPFGLTSLVAVDSRSEVWEPVLQDLVAELERRDSTLPIEEIWALDCTLQGDAAILNDDVIGSTCACRAGSLAFQTSRSSIEPQTIGPRTDATCSTLSRTISTRPTPAPTQTRSLDPHQTSPASWVCSTTSPRSIRVRPSPPNGHTAVG